MRFDRTKLLRTFRDKIERGEPIIGGGAGTGLSAKCEEAGGIDLIVIYNSGRYRMAGRGSLAGLMAYGDANQIVVEMAAEVLPWCATRRCWPASTAPTRSGSWTCSSTS
jgi:predicted TIM-barrel enzyme